MGYPTFEGPSLPCKEPMTCFPLYIHAIQQDQTISYCPKGMWSAKENVTGIAVMTIPEGVKCDKLGIPNGVSIRRW